MSVISIICFLIFTSTLLTGFRKNSDLFAPARIFVMIWSLAIGLAELKLSFYQHEWSLYSWSTLLIGIFSFLSGIILIYLFRINHPVLNRTNFRETVTSKGINEKLFYSLTMLLFIFYIIGYLGTVIIKGFIPALHPLPGESRTQITVFAFGLLIHSAPVILLLVVEYFLYSKSKIKLRKYVLVTTAIITLITYTLLLQRMDLFMGMVLIFIVLYYAGRIKSIYIIGGGFLFSIIMYTIMNLRFVKHVEKYVYITSKMKFSEQYSFLTEPYMYIVMNLENFSRGVEKLYYHTYGYFTFNPILSITGLKHMLLKYFNINEMELLISGYNTYPFHWYYYFDFGLVGLLIFPFLYGVFVSLIYSKMIQQQNFAWLAIYAIIAFSVLMSFFFNAFTLLHFVYNVITLSIIHLVCVKHERLSSK